MNYIGNTHIAEKINECLPNDCHVYAYHDEAKGYAFIINGNPIWQFISYKELECKSKVSIKWA